MKDVPLVHGWQAVHTKAARDNYAFTQTLVQHLSPVFQLPSTYQQRNLQIEAVLRLQALEVLLSKDPEAECDRNMGPSFTYMADMPMVLL